MATQSASSSSPIRRWTAVEHETDHINGTLYIDHLENADKLWKLEPQEVGHPDEVGTGAQAGAN